MIRGNSLAFDSEDPTTSVSDRLLGFFERNGDLRELRRKYEGAPAVTDAIDFMAEKGRSFNSAASATGSKPAEPPEVAASSIDGPFGISQACDFLAALDSQITERGLRLACANGRVRGARQLGTRGEWSISHEGLEAFARERKG